MQPSGVPPPPCGKPAGEHKTDPGTAHPPTTPPSPSLPHYCTTATPPSVHACIGPCQAFLPTRSLRHRGACSGPCLPAKRPTGAFFLSQFESRASYIERYPHNGTGHPRTSRPADSRGVAGRRALVQVGCRGLRLVQVVQACMPGCPACPLHGGRVVSRELEAPPDTDDQC